LMSEVPFPKNRRSVTLLLYQLRKRHFVFIQPNLGLRPERTLNSDAVRVTPSQQRRTRSRAHWLRHIKIRELAALAREAIQVRRSCLTLAVAEGLDVRVAKVIRVNQNDVRAIRRRASRQRQPEEHRHQKKEARAVHRSKCD